MNDLPWIKFKPDRMMLDILGMSALCKVAHFQLFCMTIINDGPRLDDDDVLRELTTCPKTDWARVKGELRQKGYKSVGGYFLHAGTIKTLNESKVEYVASYNRTTKVNNTKPLILSEPDNVTGCVTYSVTPDVTLNVTLNVTPTVTPTHLHLQEHLQSNKKTTKLPASFTDEQKHLTADFQEALGLEWENDRQKWMGRIKNFTPKTARVLFEVQNAIREKRIKKTPACYAEQIWKEFK